MKLTISEQVSNLSFVVVGIVIFLAILTIEVDHQLRKVENKERTDRACLTNSSYYANGFSSGMFQQCLDDKKSQR